MPERKQIPKMFLDSSDDEEDGDGEADVPKSKPVAKPPKPKAPQSKSSSKRKAPEAEKFLDSSDDEEDGEADVPKSKPVTKPPKPKAPQSKSSSKRKAPEAEKAPRQQPQRSARRTGAYSDECGAQSDDHDDSEGASAWTAGGTLEMDDGYTRFEDDSDYGRVSDEPQSAGSGNNSGLSSDDDDSSRQQESDENVPRLTGPSVLFSPQPNTVVFLNMTGEADCATQQYPTVPVFVTAVRGQMMDIRWFNRSWVTSEFNPKLKYVTYEKFWTNPNFAAGQKKKPTREMIAEFWAEQEVETSWCLPIQIPSSLFNVESIWDNDTFKLPTEFMQKTVIPECLKCDCIHELKMKTKKK